MGKAFCEREPNRSGSQICGDRAMRGARKVVWRAAAQQTPRKPSIPLKCIRNETKSYITLPCTGTSCGSPVCGHGVFGGQPSCPARVHSHFRDGHRGRPG